jgi:PAS domain S-box-containing protein
MQAKDGTWRWFLVHGQARWNEHGAPVRMAGSTIDITAQKQAESALHTMEERFRQLAEGSSEVFWLIQPQPEQLLYISPSFERIWGIGADHVQANPGEWIDSIHQEDRGAVQQARSDLIASQGRSTYDIEYRIVRPDGTLRWIHDRASLIVDERGSPALISGIAGDVTDRRRSEEVEREMNQRISALVEASPLPIVALSGEGIVTGWNPAAERVFGYSAAEALGHYLPIVPPDQDEQFRAFRREVMAGSPFMGRQVRRRHKNGADLDLTISTALLRRADGRVLGLMVIYEDVTEQRRMEQMSRQLQDRMLESQKLESLGVLAGGIAHDFNNLLTLILGNTHLARSELSPRSPAFESLQQVELATLRASELTAQMLAYAGKGRFVIGPVDLTAVLRGSAPLLEAALPGGARLRFELAEELPVIEADPAQLQQVLVNLVTNAGEALQRTRRSVTIRTGSFHADRGYLVSTVLPKDLPEGTYAYVEVEDEGTGMSQEIQDRMFEPFFSTRFSGRGLGLAAVLGIVRRHRGTVRVDSHPGQGTVIRVLFPVVGSASRVSRSQYPEIGMPRVSAEVLLVDDEEGVLTLMRRFLERAGYSVRTASSGEEGLARFRESRGSLSAVILDLNMPGMGGDEALLAIRALDPELPVIVTSGYSEEEVGRRCAGARISAVLPKPYLPAELIEEVRRAIMGAHPRPG